MKNDQISQPIDGRITYSQMVGVGVNVAAAGYEPLQGRGIRSDGEGLQLIRCVDVYRTENRRSTYIA